MQAFGWSMQERTLYDGIPTLVRFFPGNALLLQHVWDYFASINDVFNDFNEQSEIGRLNANNLVGTVEVSPPLAEALRFSLDMAERVAGGFDITLAPLRTLWRDAAKTGSMPDNVAIDGARARTGLHHLQLEGRQLTRKVPGMRLDLGGIIKGLAVDHAMAMVRDAGVEAAFIQMGAETAAFGLSPRGLPHVLRFDIALPNTPSPFCLADPGTGLCGSSSANDARPIIIDDVPFYHIFDPRTGKPISSNVLQVSVYFPRVGANGLAEVLTKVGAIMGFEHMLPLLTRFGAEALFLYRNAQGSATRATPGWQRFVQTTAMNEPDWEPKARSVG